MVPYKALWRLLLLGWVVSYADRTLTFDSRAARKYVLDPHGMLGGTR